MYFSTSERTWTWSKRRDILWELEAGTDVNSLKEVTQMGAKTSGGKKGSKKVAKKATSGRSNAVVNVKGNKKLAQLKAAQKAKKKK